MLFRFCLYGFLKNQRYFEPFLMLVLLERDLSFTMIGSLIAVQAVTVNLLEIPSGAIADAMGRRSAMVGSFCAYALGFLALAWADSKYLLFPAMVLLGIGDSFRTGTHKAMIFEWLRIQGRTDERTKIYGFTRSWSKIGSAVSGILAATFVFISDSYDHVFLFATVPCVLNIINLSGYPQALDGIAEGKHRFHEAWDRARLTMQHAIGSRTLRGLLVESMSWDGVFHAVKDYLQPILAALSVAAIGKWFPVADWSPVQQSAVLVGPCYVILFLLSAAASRHAYRIQEIAGSTAAATAWLWSVNGALFVWLTILGWQQALPGMAIVFVLLHLMQNLWRPIFIGRFDDFADADEGATVLSIESQMQRLATMVIAPALGLVMDTMATPDGVEVYWPIGLVGVCACALVLARITNPLRHRPGPPTPPPE